MPRKRPHILLATLAIAAPLLGCGGGDELDRQPISGSVTLDGQPLESGLITFDPASNQSITSVATEITQGEFSFNRTNGPVPGEYRVVINSAGSTGVEPGAGEAPGDTFIPPAEELVPKKYNAETTLRATVEAGDNPPIVFELTSG
ncbi:hypothetical protein [Tautonia sociabilis]|uniref:Carboxypeptidase regulatory-like domain-containing protein n=1 Tax=Tautonia sociabilis TaxID=2080755 RepID=A0A432MMX3_9BACT|nr:hypothetical protein [Tautonia sociabilis]RUL88599.1 hypothetical protein TsocGM_06665 [Tautonia sociabilis]